MPQKQQNIERHPTMDTQRSVPDLKTLRARIPPHCFQASLLTSLGFVLRDLVLLVLLATATTQISHIDQSILRALCWALYGFVQGLMFTGIWILAHECGHDAFSAHRTPNAVIGFFLHSLVLVPFFSWKYTHSRHHRFANHMDKDTVFAPARKVEYRSTIWSGSFLGHAEDTGIVSLLLFVGHQVFGWPLYIAMNAGAGSKSLVIHEKPAITRQSHLDPGAFIFRPEERSLVLLSDLGLAVILTGLWYLSKTFGAFHMFLLYGVPYLWMNHWLVAITYLHHTHPDAPHYEEGSWTFQQGALSTVDRDFGFIGRHMFHGIIEYHVIHHMFPHIPFYHAEEATKAIAPSLGKAYLQQRTSFLRDLWSMFTTCAFVEESGERQGLMYWNRGRSHA